VFKDLRHGVRMLLRAKGWTASSSSRWRSASARTRALFSAINGLYLKTLPVKDPDTLARLRFAGRNQMSNSSSDYGFSGKDAGGLNMRSTFSYPMFQQFRRRQHHDEELFACAPYGRANLVVDGQATLPRRSFPRATTTGCSG